MMGRKGFTLTEVLMAVLVIGILASAAVAALYAARGGAGMSHVLLRSRPPARYAAEAGLVRAYERLRSDPAYPGETLMVDVDGNGTPETRVTITVSAPDAAGRRSISARVTY